jgi:hypothetical protein
MYSRRRIYRRLKDQRGPLSWGHGRESWRDVDTGRSHFKAATYVSHRDSLMTELGLFLQYSSILPRTSVSQTEAFVTGINHIWGQVHCLWLSYTS